MRIVVLSGKGGTGKTTVSVNLALTLSSRTPVCLADFDVEEPDLSQFFYSGVPVYSRPVTVPVPAIDPGRCTHCGACGEFCRYGALVVLPDRVLVNPELCHSCGGCQIICPETAIAETGIHCGEITDSHPLPGIRLVCGILSEESIHSTAVLKAVKNHIRDESVIIADGPPGTACLAIESVKDADFCLLVTEPTPFGLHDLIQMTEVIRILQKPAAVVINRSLGNDESITRFCADEEIPVLMTIPFSREIAYLQAGGTPISQVDDTWRSGFERLGQTCMSLAGGSR